MKILTSALKGAVATAGVIAAANADAHQFYDFPAVGTCEPYFPSDASSVIHETNGDLTNSATSAKWFHCGLAARDIARNGKISAYVYGTTNGTVSCTLAATPSASGVAVFGSASTTVNGNFRVQLPWVSIAPDINNFIVASAYCQLPAGSKLRAIRLFDFTP